MPRVVNRIFLGQCLRAFILMVLLPSVCLASSPTETQPKFTIVSISPFTQSVSPGETIFVTYRVTNKTKVSRQLTMVPIPGVTPVVMSGSCGNSFFLNSGDSCLLILQINGSQIPAQGIHSGPEVCKTQPNSTQPDPFLCSRASHANALDINPGTTIDVTPNPLSVVLSPSGSGSGTVEIANTGSNPVQGLQLVVSAGTASLSSTCSSTLAVGGSCTAQLTSSTAQSGQVQIFGSNTNSVPLFYDFVSYTTSSTLSIVSPSVGNRIIPLETGSDLTLTIRNNGPTSVSNITLDNHPGCLNVSVSATTCGGSIPVNGTCQLSLVSTANMPYLTCPISISALGAVPLNTNVAFSKTLIPTPGFSFTGLVYNIVGNQAYIIMTVDPAGQNGLAPWWIGISSLIGATSLTDGSNNTTLILNAWTPGVQDISAAVCQRAPLDNTWFLPAICELSGASICAPGTPNVQTNLLNLGFMQNLVTGANGTGVYWSSTENGSNQAWGQNFQTNSAAALYNKSLSLGVRCATSFSF